MPYKNSCGFLLLPETTEGLTEHIRGADVLVIEVTFLDRDAAIARDYGHLTATEAAPLAAMSGVKLPPDEEILAEATKTFRTAGLQQISTASLFNRPRRRASEWRGS